MGFEFDPVRRLGDNVSVDLTMSESDVLTENDLKWLFRLLNEKFSDVLISGERDELREVSRKLHILDRAIDRRRESA